MANKHFQERGIEYLYSAGPCPCDLADGAQLCLLSLSTLRLVYFCPFCGCAWRSPVRIGDREVVMALDEVAPDGVALPSHEAVSSSESPHTLADYGEWISDLRYEIDRTWPGYNTAV